MGVPLSSNHAIAYGCVASHQQCHLTPGLAASRPNRLEERLQQKESRRQEEPRRGVLRRPPRHVMFEVPLRRFGVLRLTSPQSPQAPHVAIVARLP